MYKTIPHSKPTVSENDALVVTEVIKSGMHATGKKTKEFEEKISKLIGMKYAKATTSGTTALHLALSTLNIGEGDEVIIPSYICQSVMSAVNHTGATPVLVDIDLDFKNKGYNISAETIKPKITKKTKAIVVAHMFGVPADIPSIRKITQEIPIIEDCAHGVGAKYDGKMIGSFGELSIFSFYATKVISTGQGGMILTSSEELKKNLENLTQYDGKEEYGIAYNYSLTDLQAALGISQLSQLLLLLKRRNAIAKKYDEAFSRTSLNLPPTIKGEIKFRYIIRTNTPKEFETLQKKLKEKGIAAYQPVFKPLHICLGSESKLFPNTEEAQSTSLSIPIYPSLTDEEVDYVIKSVKESLKK